MAERPRRASPILGALLAGVLTSCGLGTGTAISASGGGGNDDAPTAIGGFGLVGTKTSPATIRFVLTDREGSPATVVFFALVPGMPGPAPLTQVAGLTSNEATLPASPQGIEYFLDWDFAAEPFLPADASFVPGVRVFALLRGGQQDVVLGANGDELGLGNDPPVVTSAAAPASEEVDGIVPIRLSVEDSSGDAVSIRAEYDVLGDAPDLGWRPARPGGLDPNDPTPDEPLVGVEAPSHGIDLVFFWDTDFDLPDLEQDVRLRFTARDEAATGEVLATDTFRVDNNAEPIATLNDAAFVTNPDRIRGIPIPYEILDPEGDEVTVVFQWRKEGEEYPELPTEPAEIRAALEDPARRVELRIASPFPIDVGGRLRPLDATSVELSELPVEAAGVITSGLVGRSLEILRSSRELVPLGAASLGLDLVHPVAALPVGDGTGALVLDRPGIGSWRLREVDLASGTVRRELADEATGDPCALAWEPGRRSVLVGTDAGGGWRLVRVTLGAVPTAVLLASAPSDGPLRGLAALNGNAAVATVDDVLLQIQYGGLALADPHHVPFSPQAEGPGRGAHVSNEEARIAIVLDGLHEPWGVVVHPTRPGSVLLAERGGSSLRARTSAGFDALPLGDVCELRLDTRERIPLAMDQGGLRERGLPHPGSLFLSEDGSCLFAVTDASPGDGVQELRALSLRLGEGQPYPLAELPEGSLTVASGAEGLRLVVLPDAEDLLLGGGVAQSRRIVAFDPETRRVELDPALSPTLLGEHSWRLEAGGPIRPRPDGSDGVFVWDSREAGGGHVLVRAVPIDAEVGLGSETGLSREVAGPLDGEDRVSLDGPFYIDVDVADLDGDGDLDSVGVGSSRSSVFVHRQGRERRFERTDVPSEGALDHEAVEAADLDGDGAPDIVSLRSNPGQDPNAPPSQLYVHFQGRGVGFEEPLIIESASFLRGGRALSVADMNGDGGLDLVTANELTKSLTIFLQDAGGRFEGDPIVILDPLRFPVHITDYKTVAAGDLDVDGDVDLVSAFGLFDDTPHVHYQVESLSFESVILGVGIAGNDHHSMHLVDMDRDGNLDIASANAQKNVASIYFQRRPRTFDVLPLELGNIFTTPFPRAIAPRDMTGNGLLDLVVSGSVTVAFFAQRSPRRFDLPTVLEGVGDGEWLCVDDMDADGALDLMAPIAPVGNPAVFLGTPPSGFESEPVVLRDPERMAQPLALVATDVDGDGDLDLATANRQSENLTFWFQTVPGVFGPVPGVLSVEGAVYFLMQADVDGDGREDLVTIREDAVLVHRRAAPLIFEPPLVVGARDGRASSIDAADIDADGDLDLVACYSGDDEVAVFEQQGSGVFEEGIVAAVDSPVAVTIADLDLDGDRDLLLGRPSSFGNSEPVLQLLEGVGDGSFVPSGVEFPLPLIYGVTRVEVRDLESDGLPDVVAGSSRAFILFQESVGAFRSVQLPGIGQNTIAIRDLDRDGDLDVAMGGNHLFYQSRPSFFARGRGLGFSGYMIASDLDGDGDADLASLVGQEVLLNYGDH